MFRQTLHCNVAIINEKKASLNGKLWLTPPWYSSLSQPEMARPKKRIDRTEIKILVLRDDG